MQIKTLDILGISDLYSFINEVFPERYDAPKIIDFWGNKSNDKPFRAVILEGYSGEIWGQILFSSMHYFYCNTNNKGEWAFDYIVREDKRKDGYGIDIMEFVLENKKVPVFATGSGPVALQLELKMGFKLLGELKKYVGIVNPLYLISSVLRGIIPLRRFPKTLSVMGTTFILTDKENLPEYSKPFNNNLLEFGRDNSFIKWRFYSDLHEYAFYVKEGGDDFFVIRTIVKNNITCSVLVDYRCNISSQDGFKTILKAAQKVTRRLKLGIMITGSSLNASDDILEKNHFKATGRHRPIISTKSFSEEKERIDNRNFILTTLADSDGEILW